MPNRITPAARPFQEARQGIGPPNQVEEDTDVHPQGRKTGGVQVSGRSDLIDENADAGRGASPAA